MDLRIRSYPSFAFNLRVGCMTVYISCKKRKVGLKKCNLDLDREQVRRTAHYFLSPPPPAFFVRCFNMSEIYMQLLNWYFTKQEHRPCGLMDKAPEVRIWGLRVRVLSWSIPFFWMNYIMIKQKDLIPWIKGFEDQVLSVLRVKFESRLYDCLHYL